MNNFAAYKQRVGKTAVFKASQLEIDRAPRQFCDYMNDVNNRFNEICKIYLKGMSIDDESFLNIPIMPKLKYVINPIALIMDRKGW